MYKVQIGTVLGLPVQVRTQALCRQSPDCPSACPHNTNVVHVYVHWPVYTCWKIGASRGVQEVDEKTFLFGKKVEASTNLELLYHS